jgi:hypothetical protein
LTEKEKLLRILTPWIETELFDWVMKMHLYRDIYRSWNDALGVTSDDVLSAGHFHRWVRDGYVASMAMAIRREVDASSDSKSLLQFLTTVRESAQLLDREWYFERAVQDSFGLEPYERQWGELATADGAHIAPEVVQADMESFTAMASAVELYATRTLAHRLDPEKKPAPTVTYEKIHDAVDEIERVFRRWYQIITARFLAQLDPYNWEYVLTVPWITYEEAEQIRQNRLP